MSSLTVYSPGTKVDLGFEKVEKTGYIHQVSIGPSLYIEYAVIVWVDGQRTIDFYHASEVSLHHENAAASKLILDIERGPTCSGNA